MYSEITAEQILAFPRAQKAMTLFCGGYSCAQSSLLAFIDLLSIDEQTAICVASSFGGGMGKLRELCGALSGVFIAVGLLYGPSKLVDKKTKEDHYARIYELGEQFRSYTNCNSFICRDLLKRELGTIGNSDSLKLIYSPAVEKPCPQLVGLAAGLLEYYIKIHPIK